MNHPLPPSRGMPCRSSGSCLSRRRNSVSVDRSAKHRLLYLVRLGESTQITIELKPNLPRRPLLTPGSPSEWRWMRPWCHGRMRRTKMIKDDQRQNWLSQWNLQPCPVADIFSWRRSSRYSWFMNSFITPNLPMNQHEPIIIYHDISWCLVQVLIKTLSCRMPTWMKQSMTILPWRWRMLAWVELMSRTLLPWKQSYQRPRSHPRRSNWSFVLWISSTSRGMAHTLRFRLACMGENLDYVNECFQCRYHANTVVLSW